MCSLLSEGGGGDEILSRRLCSRKGASFRKKSIDRRHASRARARPPGAALDPNPIAAIRVRLLLGSGVEREALESWKALGKRGGKRRRFARRGGPNRRRARAREERERNQQSFALLPPRAGASIAAHSSPPVPGSRRPRGRPRTGLCTKTWWASGLGIEFEKFRISSKLKNGMREKFFSLSSRKKNGSTLNAPPRRALWLLFSRAGLSGSTPTV